VPAVPARIHAGGDLRGGVIGYPLDQAHREVAFVAYHFHWPHDDIMNLEHGERRKWVAEISDINRRISAGDV
jgi:hypothetical protein